MRLEREQIERVVKRLKEAGAEEREPPRYAAYRLKMEDGELIVYESGSLVYSGKGKEKVKERVIGELLSMEKNLPKVGCDEAGKGEFFGPLVVACVCAEKGCLEELLRLEVKDSKKLKREKLMELSERIKEKCKGVVRVIYPERYNREYERFKNLNRYLEEIYSEVVEKVVKKCKPKEVVIDRFSKKVERVIGEKFRGIKVVAKEKGEDDPVVAAASIVAKAERLKVLEELSKELGFKVEEGNLKSGELLKRIPEGELHRFVKLHFRVKEK